MYAIIKGHTAYPYSSSSTDVWDTLKETDRDPKNPANVIGIYSGFSMGAAKEYDSGAGWNREHVWAKSRGDFGTTLGAGTDVHHLRAADISTNSARNNRNFDEATIQYVDDSGNYQGPTPSYTSDTEWIWEARESVKGDVPCMIFYMATRYEGENGEPDLELVEELQDRLSKEPFHARLSVLVQWHLNDPVDERERQRNEVIYSYQKNRNPYIDHPEYVCSVWPAACGGSTPTNTAPAFASTPVTTASEGQLYTYDISATDAEGDTLSFSTTAIPAWAGRTYNEGYSVWIDFNADGGFTDAGELVFSQSRTKNSPIGGTVNIPSSAISGTIRMRVSMKYNKEPGSCESFSYGEVEGYSINISSTAVARTGSPADVQVLEMAKEEALLSLYPNPAKEQLWVEPELQENEVALLQIFDSSGKTVYQQQFVGGAKTAAWK